MKTKQVELKKQIKNLRSHIFMKCLECTNCQPKEIIICPISDCPLWQTRPLEAKGLYTLIKQLKQKNTGSNEGEK